MRNNYRFTLAFLLVLPSIIWSQDLHFTQFYNTPLHVNPALTGIFNGDQRYIAAYRGQWYVADAPYTTFYGMYDQKLYNQKFKKAFLGLGGMLGYDRAGDSKLSLFNFGLTGSYNYALDPENFVSGGLMLGLAQRSFKTGGLEWGSQYENGQFQPSEPSGENFDQTGYVYPDLGVGVNYRGQKLTTRTTLDLGISLFHFHQPNQSFGDQEKSKLQPRTSFHLIHNIQLTDRFDIYYNGLVQLQNKYLESVAGLGGKYILDQRRGKELAVQGGAAFRFNSIGDAAVGTVELHYQYWRLGFSYDINVSGYKTASNRNGGPEVTLRYVVHFVKPIPVFRVCPII